MALFINTNVGSLFTQQALNKSQNAMQTSLQRLSSGMRINSAKDDATGLVNGTIADSQLRGTNQAIRNANDGISTAQTADGAMNQITENLQRLRELAVQNGGTLPAAGASPEVDALFAENVRINGTVAAAGGKVVNDANGGTYTNVGGKPTLTAAGALTVANLDTDIAAVNTARAGYGADMASLGSAINNMQVASVNIAAAKSRIMDTDYAAETATMTRNQIMQQAGTAMLAQANQLPNSVMTLLK